MKINYKHIILFLYYLIIGGCAATKKTDTPIIDSVRVSVTYVPYTFCFSAKNEKFVSSYKLMRSKNSKTGFNTIATYAPKNSKDSSLYCYQLAKSSIAYYYKVIATCTNNVYTSPLTYLKSTLK